MLVTGNTTLTANYTKIYEPNPVGEVAAGGLIWAKTNIAAKGVFATEEYAYDGANQYSWTEITGGVSGQTAAGYCPLGWRLPSQAEYATLFTTFTSTGITVNGFSGRRVTIFATGETMFFASSGIEGGTGYVGTNGGWWTSTQYSPTQGYNMGFSPSEFGLSGYNRKEVKLSVRCVRD